MRTAPAAAAAVLLLGSAGCGHGGGPPGTAPGGTPTSVAAFPRAPRVAGPIPITLQPALRLVDAGTCEPAPGAVYCTADGAYRALGRHRAVTVDRVVTVPSADHGSWSTLVRFAAGSADAVRSAAGTARGLGGVVLLVRGSDAVALVAPPDVRRVRGVATARFLGLAKAEAWALVAAFGPS